MNKLLITLLATGSVMITHPMEYAPVPQDDPGSIYEAIDRSNEKALRRCIAEGQTNRGTLICLAGTHLETNAPLQIVDKTALCGLYHKHTEQVVTPMYYALQQRKFGDASTLLDGGAELRTGLFCRESAFCLGCEFSNRQDKDSSACLLAHYACEEKLPEALALLKKAIEKKRSLKTACWFTLEGQEYWGSVVTLPEETRNQSQSLPSRNTASLVMDICLAKKLRLLDPQLRDEIAKSECFYPETFLEDMRRIFNEGGPVYAWLYEMCMNEQVGPTLSSSHEYTDNHHNLTEDDSSESEKES